MRVMVLVKASEKSEAGEHDPVILAKMTKFNEELAKAGVLLGMEGLAPTKDAVRVRFAGKDRKVIDGPFSETKELVGGFWLWQVRSLEEAIEWLKRAPLEEGDVEIRRVFEMEDFGEVFPEPLQRREKAALEMAQANKQKPAAKKPKK